MPDPFSTSFLIQTSWSPIMFILQMVNGALTDIITLISHFCSWRGMVRERLTQAEGHSVAQIDKASYWKMLLCQNEWWQRNLKVDLQNVDGPRVCYTDRSKSEREKQILYINSCMWNLEKRYWWTYVQGRNRDADVENGLVDMEGRETRMNWEIRIDIYTLHG